MDTWEIGRAPTQEGFLLFVDWLWFLLEESFGSKRIGKSQNKYEIVLGDEQPVAVSYDPGARAARRRTGDVGQGSNSRGIGVCPCMRRAPRFEGGSSYPCFDRAQLGGGFAAIPCSRIGWAKYSRPLRSIALSICRRWPSSFSAFTIRWTWECCWCAGDSDLPRQRRHAGRSTSPDRRIASICCTLPVQPHAGLKSGLLFEVDHLIFPRMVLLKPPGDASFLRQTNQPESVMRLAVVQRGIGILAVLACLCLPAGAETPRDGSHDFDFARGEWHTHVTRILDPFDGGTHTATMEGTKTAKPVWGGRAWMEEIEADGAGGHWEGATFFLYNPKSGQWSQQYIDSASGSFSRRRSGASTTGVVSSMRRRPITTGWCWCAGCGRTLRPTPIATKFPTRRTVGKPGWRRSRPT